MLNNKINEKEITLYDVIHSFIKSEGKQIFISLPISYTNLKEDIKTFLNKYEGKYLLRTKNTKEKKIIGILKKDKCDTNEILSFYSKAKSISLAKTICIKSYLAPIDICPVNCITENSKLEEAIIEEVIEKSLPFYIKITNRNKKEIISIKNSYVLEKIMDYFSIIQEDDCFESGNYICITAKYPSTLYEKTLYFDNDINLDKKFDEFFNIIESINNAFDIELHSIVTLKDLVDKDNFILRYKQNLSLIISDAIKNHLDKEYNLLGIDCGFIDSSYVKEALILNKNRNELNKYSILEDMKIQEGTIILANKYPRLRLEQKIINLEESVLNKMNTNSIPTNLSTKLDMIHEKSVDFKINEIEGCLLGIEYIDKFMYDTYSLGIVIDKDLFRNNSIMILTIEKNKENSLELKSVLKY